MPLSEFLAESSSHLCTATDESGKGLCEGSRIEPLRRFQALFIPFILALLCWRLLCVLLGSSELGCDIIFNDFFGPILPMSLSLHVILGQSEYLQGFDKEFPWSHHHAFQVTGILRIATEEIRGIVDFKASSPSFEECFESRNIECLEHGFIIGDILQLQLDFTLLFLTELLQDHSLSHLQGLQPFLLDQFSEFLCFFIISEGLLMLQALVSLGNSRSEIRFQQLIIGAKLEVLIEQLVVNFCGNTHKPDGLIPHLSHDSLSL